MVWSRCNALGIFAHAAERRMIMAEYIEREAAIAAIMSEPPDAHYPHWYADKIKAIASADVAPVKHGRWGSNGIPDSMLSACSVCGFGCGAYSFQYCPNCGAKMDGDENGDKNRAL